MSLRLHTDGRWIKDSYGIIVQLRGVGQSELFETSLTETWYRDHQIPSQYDMIKGLNPSCNLVRVMIRKSFWDDDILITSVEGVTSTYRNVLTNIVEMCLARNMYVLISLDGTDRVNYLLNPEGSGWLPILREIATLLGSYPNVLIDPMNEPARAGAYLDEHITIWRNAAIQAIEAIRAIVPDIVLMIQPSAGTYNAVKEFSNTYGLGHLPYPNIIYGSHHYYYSDTIWIKHWVQVYREGRFEDAKGFRPPAEYDYDANRPLTLMEHLYYMKIGVLSDEGVPVIIDEFGTRIDRTLHYVGTYPEGQWVTDIIPDPARGVYDPALILEQDGPFSWYAELTDFYEIMNRYGWSFCQWAWRAEYRTDSESVYNTMLLFGWTELNEIGKLFRKSAFRKNICITGQVFNLDGLPIINGKVSGNGQQSITDSNGRYELFLSIKEDDYVIKFNNGLWGKIILDGTTSHLANIFPTEEPPPLDVFPIAIAILTGIGIIAIWKK